MNQNTQLHAQWENGGGTRLDFGPYPSSESGILSDPLMKQWVSVSRGADCWVF